MDPPSYSLILLLCSLGTALSRDDVTSYDPGPYKRVYPPANLSLEQQSCQPDAATNQTCPLYVALMMSFGGVYTSSGVIPAVEVALDQINLDPNMLPGYTLHYTLKDSQCSRTVALDSLHTEIIQPPTKIAVLGSGCSVATEPTAEVSHYYNITQLSCSSSSTELTNRERFPRHFQLSTAEISLAYGFFGVIQTFRWRRVSIITQDENLFTVTMAELKRLLSATNVMFTETRFESDVGIDVNPFTSDPDGRIFILSMYDGFAREILCMAYSVSNNFRYPQYLFFVNGWYNDRWWVGSEEEQAELIRKYNCDAAQRESLLPSTLAPATSGRTVLNYSVVADNGYTGDEVRTAYEEALKTSPFNLTELFLYQLCYDATWTLARALNNTINDLESSTELQEKLQQGDFLGDPVDGSNFGLQHFTYDNDVLLENIFDHLAATSYNGIVGNISFNSNGSRRIDKVELLQYRVNSTGVLRAVPVASVVRQSEFQFTIVYLEENGTLWTDGVPYDGVPTESMVTVHFSITVIFSILATCGIAFATVCITLNIYFRKKKIIQLTSPNLNTIIGIGAIVLYFNMYLFVIPTTNQTAISVLCHLDTWLTAIGYSLCYGTILAKMCRVYYIFHNPGLKKKTLKDWLLALFVLSLVIVDLIILLSYTISQGVLGNLTAERVLNRENPEDTVGVSGEIFRYYTYVCLSRQRYITLGVLYGYKALLQIVALIFAISIRKVHIKGLNDAVYIISAIYVTSIVTTVVVVSTYTLTELINVYATVFCICFFIGTTVILGLVFMPPLIGLYKDPEGDSVFRDSSAKGGICNVENQLNLTGVETTSLKFEAETSVSLRKRIKSLEDELEKMRMENAKLRSDDNAEISAGTESEAETTGSKL